MLEDNELVMTACGQIIVARQEREARCAAEEKLTAMAALDGLNRHPQPQVALNTPPFVIRLTSVAWSNSFMYSTNFRKRPPQFCLPSILSLATWSP